MQPTIYLHPAIQTDVSLAHRVAAHLGALSIPSFRFLQIEVEHGLVTLSGRVRTYYERQLAQSHARRVPGVARVVDQIQVVQPSSLNLASHQGLPLSGPLTKRVAARRAGDSPSRLIG